MADPFEDFGSPVPFTTDSVPQLQRKSSAKVPSEDPQSWAAPIFGPHRPPGKWKITGERARRIDQPEKKGKNNDALIDQGIARGEVAFEVETYTGQQFRDLQDFYDQYLSPDRPLNKANVTPIAYPALYVRGVKAVYGFRASFPMPRSDKGDSPMVSSFTAKVVNDNTRIGGQGSRKPKTKSAQAVQNGSRLDVLVQGLQAGTLGLFGLILGDSDDVKGLLHSAGVTKSSDLFLQAPASTSPVILPYKDATALSIFTGSIEDRMVSDVSAARAPR